MKFLAAGLLIACSSLGSSAPPLAHHQAHRALPPRTEGSAQTKNSDNRQTKENFQAKESRSSGLVLVAGQAIHYDAVAGTIIVHAKGWDDSDEAEDDAASQNNDKEKAGPKAEASIYYTAYFKQGSPAAGRPITFLFNGGPDSSSIWLIASQFDRFERDFTTLAD